MNNYISKVLSRITDKSNKKQIEAELQAHIDDRIDYYVNAGYDLETATEKANEQMGETAELVGEQLNSMINSKINVILMILFILLNLGVLFVFSMCTLADAVDACFKDNSFHLLISSIYLSFVFIELYISVKIKNYFLAVSSCVLFGLHGLYNLGYTPVVFCFYEFVTGKGKIIADLMNTYNFRCSGVIVYSLCVLFIIGCCFLAYYACRHIKKFNNLNYGKNDYKSERNFKLTVFVMLLFVVLVASFSLNSCYHDESLNNETNSCEGFYFIDSDVKINPQQITDYEDKLLQYQYDLFSSDSVDAECVSYEEQHSWETSDYYDNYPISHYNLETHYNKYDDLNRAVKYRTNKITADFRTDKKYVMIVPMYKNNADDAECYPDFSKAEWIAVSDKTVIHSKEREFKHKGLQLITFVEYEITIIPAN